ncbi:hydrogenase maturation nickel metallochaperone HypA [Adlercreutzia shanghongiae]|uniref:Hydrogenase maturation factor HypA n=1 Tax=Adlercreutzia shanghongiae TaxID=3111773 RepID=A0ABU6J0M9_9ACTN|nr:hydrogenase maturation nickel metallochaperone HypA [Adlercreutzia sp. R22]MEC4295402.1 hydrogenase maturation nickel metallochaperone HypA [Adlercreutzia sp. R22]
MHEMGLVRPLVDAVLDHCEEAGAAEVLSVRLSIGEYVDVIERFIPQMFSFLARGTIAEHAEVVIERVPGYAACNSCNNIFSLDTQDKSTWHCPRCGERNYRMFSGREFRIDSIEIREASAELRPAV